METNLILPKITISVSFDKKAEGHELFTIKGPQDCADVMRRIFNADTFAWTEEFVMICLNAANQVVGYYKLSSGGTKSALCDPRVVFTVALTTMAATSIMIAHNHPSGRLQPSRADDNVTRNLVRGGLLLGIKVLDHVILSQDGYYSYQENDRLEDMATLD